MPKRNKQLKVQNNKRLEVKWLKDVVDNDNDDDDDDMDYQYERFTRVQSPEGASWKEYIYVSFCLHEFCTTTSTQKHPVA